jgi:rhamnulokinase
MKHTSNYLAFDLGASGGRAMVGHLDGERLTLETIHRFPNGPVQVFGNLYWDVLRLFDELRAGLGAYARAYGSAPAGIGLDTWGVDFALLGRNDALLGNPRHYRDPRTDGMLEAAFARVPREEVFSQTGIQFMQINTLYQLLAMRLQDDPALDQARTFLMIPDLLNYWLTGVKANEFSDATTSQMYNPRTRTWAKPLLEALDLPTAFLQEIVPPGSVLGPLHGTLADAFGMQGAQVIAPATHDTGSAVAAVPAVGSDYAYISSGTWSLMGVETPEPVINADSLAYNFTNEGGVLGTFRLLKNIMGLWLLQESRRTWMQEGAEHSWDELVALAEQAPAFGAVIEPDSHAFLRPGDMPARIRAYCQRTGQRVPQSKGEIMRCIMESLALKYRWVLEKLELLLGKPLRTIHVVGGGCQNRLLCQFTADATQRPVVAGPVEATAMGNILMQALARGEIASLAEGRELVRRSFNVRTYEPSAPEPWQAAYERYLALRERYPEE